MVNIHIQQIVQKASELKDKHTTEKDAPVNYACIFSQSEKEYRDLEQEISKMGKVVQETKMGNVYLLTEPIETVAGPVRIIKIRKPDPTRPERGDADFTVSDYRKFKREYLHTPGFSLMERPEMEMIELVNQQFDVRAYFSHPILAEVLKITL